MTSKLTTEIIDALIDGSVTELCKLIQSALAADTKAQDILENGLLKGMLIIEEEYKNGDVFIPEVLLTARAMNQALELLRPIFKRDCHSNIGTVVLGTVKGDIHSIGKDMVGIMMESYGLEVIDLGTNVDSGRFCQAAIDHRADIVACSALLTTCSIEMKKVVQLLEKSNYRDQITILIGGKAVSKRFCKAISADYYTEDAFSAARLAKRICLRKKLAKELQD